MNSVAGFRLRLEEQLTPALLRPSPSNSMSLDASTGECADAGCDIQLLVFDDISRRTIAVAFGGLTPASFVSKGRQRGQSCCRVVPW